jgi:hypothetical protein
MIAGVTEFGPTLAGKDPDTILQGAKNGAVTNSKGRLISEKPITLGANHGIAFELESDGARHCPGVPGGHKHLRDDRCLSAQDRIRGHYALPGFAPAD